MMNVIIEEDLYDHEFVDNWCYGFERAARGARSEFTLERVAEITWVPAEKIARGRPHAGKAEKPATLQWGVARRHDHARPCRPARPSWRCGQITGNMERPGRHDRAPPRDPVRGRRLGPRAAWAPEQEKKRIGIEDYPLLQASASRVSQPDDDGQDHRDGRPPYEIQARTGCRPPTRWPAWAPNPQSAVRRPSSKLDFIVVVDLFMTPTIAGVGCDVVLPARTFPERNGMRLHLRCAARDRPSTRSSTVGEMQVRHGDQPGAGHAHGTPRLWPWDNVGRDVHRHARSPPA